MSSAGGPGYKWRGKNIRQISRKGVSCITLPRKDSLVIIPSKVKPNKNYRISITAKNAGGNGTLSARFSNCLCKSSVVFISSKDFSNSSVDVRVDRVDGSSNNLEIFRPKGSYGNIIITNISVKQVVEEPKKELKIVEPAKKIDTERLNQIKEQNNKRLYEERKVLAEKIRKARNFTNIGGNGYLWKGKGVRTISKYGSSCACLFRPNSVLLSPVQIKENAEYRVTISASKSGENDNEELYINFYSGRRNSGNLSKIKVGSKNLREYSVNVKAVNINPNKTHLRVWRNRGSSGMVFIREIKYSFIRSIDKNIIKVGVSKKIKEAVKKEFLNYIKKVKEKVDMKFRPYDKISGILAEKVNKVVVTSKNDVPLVSIITPTRDGLENIKKCWDALSKYTAYPNWEWIVGDSQSSDQTADFIKGLKDNRIKLIERGTTDGSFSSINNELVKYSGGEYLVFLNDDTEPQPLWLYEMMSKIKRYKEVSIVGSRLMYNDKKVQHAGIAFINEGPANIGHQVLKTFPAGFESYDRFFQAVTAACMLISRKDFDDVGGFDERYYFCYEDVDLCLKVGAKLNKKVLYAHNSFLYHRESVTQNKHKTAGSKQKEGIEYFKKKWMGVVKKDFYSYMSPENIKKNILPVDLSFVTCVSDVRQFNNYIVGSLFNTQSKKNYEIIPIFNVGNKYSAAKALNIGIKNSRSDVVVTIHQDCILYEDWIDILFERIKEIEKKDKKWGVLGTAGITAKDDTIGTVHNTKGKLQWVSSKAVKYYPVQTVDEHCLILNKRVKLFFDDRTFSGFHFYGSCICLESLHRGHKVYGILCPLVHDSRSASLLSGRPEFIKYLNALNKKWGSKFKTIRTPTSIIQHGKARTFIKFK